MVIIGSIPARRSSLAATAIDDSPAILTVEPARFADGPMLTNVIAGAFLNDPTWSWAFPDPAPRRRFWKFCIDSALRYPWDLKTNGFETVSVWIPPTGTEFTDEDEAKLPTC